MLFTVRTLYVVLAVATTTQQQANGFSIGRGSSNVMSPVRPVAASAAGAATPMTLHNYLDSLSSADYYYYSGNVMSSTDNYLNSLNQVDALASYYNNAEDYIYNMADVFSSTSSFLADAASDVVSDAASTVSDVLSTAASTVSDVAAASVNSPFSASTLESMQHMVANADAAVPNLAAAAAATTAATVAATTTATPAATTVAAAAAPAATTAIAVAPASTTGATVAGTSIPAAPAAAATAAKATTVAATTTAAASAPAAPVAAAATKAATVVAPAAKAAAAATAATVKYNDAVTGAVTKAASNSPPAFQVPSLPDFNVPLPKVGLADLSLKFKVPELEIPDYSNFDIHDLPWPQVPGTDDISVGDVLFTVVDGIKVVGQTTLNILENIAADPTVNAILTSASKAVSGVVGSAVASVTHKFSELQTDISGMTIQQAIAVVVQVLTVVSKILLSIVTAVITVLSGRTPVEWSQYATAGIEHKTAELLAQASATINDISHTTLADLTASVGHFSHDIASVLASSIDSSGSMIAASGVF